MDPESRRLTADDGTELHFYRWLPRRKTRWLFVVVHGHGEHAGRYQTMADHFASRGAVVYALDLRGHGRSGGIRGHATSFAAYVSDLRKTVILARHENPGLTTVLVGHSWGGAIALAYAQARPDDADLLVLSSPMLKVRMTVPGWKVGMAKVLARLRPSHTLPTRLDAEGLSNDPEVVKAYQSDPLVHDRLSAAAYTSWVQTVPRLHAGAASMKMPILVLHGEGDPIIDPKGTSEFAELLTASDHEYISLPGLRHEPFNEIGREDVYARIEDWLQSRGSRRPAAAEIQATVAEKPELVAANGVEKEQPAPRVAASAGARAAGAVRGRPRRTAAGTAAVGAAQPVPVAETATPARARGEAVTSGPGSKASFADVVGDLLGLGEVTTESASSAEQVSAAPAGRTRRSAARPVTRTTAATPRRSIRATPTSTEEAKPARSTATRSRAKAAEQETPSTARDAASRSRTAPGRAAAKTAATKKAPVTRTAATKKAPVTRTAATKTAATRTTAAKTAVTKKAPVTRTAATKTAATKTAATKTAATRTAATRTAATKTAATKTAAKKTAATKKALVTRTAATRTAAAKTAAAKTAAAKTAAAKPRTTTRSTSKSGAGSADTPRRGRPRKEEPTPAVKTRSSSSSTTRKRGS